MLFLESKTKNPPSKASEIPKIIEKTPILMQGRSNDSKSKGIYLCYVVTLSLRLRKCL